MSLDDEQKRRYARHIVLPEIGEAGQEKLLGASALIVGLGGLGAASATALAASGIGRLGLVEPDRVELSNLHRQTLYETADIGQYKVAAAEARLSELNPDIVIHSFCEKLHAQNAEKRMKEYDIIVDGTDNYETRFIINDTAMKLAKPWVYAAMLGFKAQIASFTPHLGAALPCYRCFVTETAERERSCAQEGIIGPLAPVVGGLQALEVIRLISGIGKTLAGSLLMIDGLTGEMRRVTLPHDPACKHLVIEP